MKIYLDPPLKGEENMKRDLELLQRSGVEQEVFLRLYSWQRPTISLGYFQKPEKVLNFKALEKYRLDYVKRPTGGRAVFHFRELTYAIAIPNNYPNLPSGITQAYRFISEPIYKAFISLGLSVKWARQEKNATEACFLAPARHEIIFNGHKLVGSAQRRTANAVLQHGSILLEAQPDLFAECLLGIDKEAFIRQLRQRTMVIPVSAWDLKIQLAAEFRRLFQKERNS